jgi:KDO2-lipid IV(A) lauroyltransferase
MLNRLVYYGIIKPLSWLPLPVLYVISDVAYFLLYHVTGYRKKVVFQNLNHSFPDKSEKEIKKIAAQFYSHLCDTIVESIRLFSMPEKEVIRRCKLLNPEVIDRYYEEGRDVVVVTGHFNNWEFAAVAVTPQVKHHCIGIYQPLTNAFFERKFSVSRKRLGLELLPKTETKDSFRRGREQPSAHYFAADQSPTYSKRVHWMTFLNQETAVAFGTEKYACEFNQPVVFGLVEKVKRGQYEITVHLITDTPNEHPKGWITEKHTRLLEKQIVEKPQYWLWTHKRWKRKRQPHEKMSKVV